MLPVAVLLVTFAGQSTTSPAVLSVALLLFTVLAVSPVRLWRLAQRGLQRLQNFPLHLSARFEALQRRDFSLEEAPHAAMSRTMRSASSFEAASMMRVKARSPA